MQQRRQYCKTKPFWAYLEQSCFVAHQECHEFVFLSYYFTSSLKLFPLDIFANFTRLLFWCLGSSITLQAVPYDTFRYKKNLIIK